MWAVGSGHQTGASSRWAQKDLVGKPPGEGVEVGEIDLPEVLDDRVILTGLPAGVKNGAPGA